MALQTSGDGAPGVVQQGTAPERCRENGGIEGTSPGGSRWTERQVPPPALLDFKMVEKLRNKDSGKVYAVVGGLNGTGLFDNWEIELNVRSSGGTKYTS